MYADRKHNLHSSPPEPKPAPQASWFPLAEIVIFSVAVLGMGGVGVFTTLDSKDPTAPGIATLVFVICILLCVGFAVLVLNSYDNRPKG